MKGILSYFCKSIGQLCIYRTELKPRLGNFIVMSSLNCAHNTSLQMRCAVVCLPRSLRRFHLRMRSIAGELCSGQGQERGCDAQFHFSRTLPPPPSPQPPAQLPPAEPRPDTCTDYLPSVDMACTAVCCTPPACSFILLQ